MKKAPLKALLGLTTLAFVLSACGINLPEPEKNLYTSIQTVQKELQSMAGFVKKDGDLKKKGERAQEAIKIIAKTLTNIENLTLSSAADPIKMLAISQIDMAARLVEKVEDVGFSTGIYDKMTEAELQKLKADTEEAENLIQGYASRLENAATQLEELKKQLLELKQE